MMQWLLYLHATHSDSQRRWSALFTFPHLPGRLLLWGVVSVLPGAHLQVQDAGVKEFVNNVLQQQKLWFKRCSQGATFCLSSKSKQQFPKQKTANEQMPSCRSATTDLSDSLIINYISFLCHFFQLMFWYCQKIQHFLQMFHINICSHTPHSCHNMDRKTDEMKGTEINSSVRTRSLLKKESVVEINVH